MHQEFVVPNIRERCSTSPMSFEVDGEKKLNTSVSAKM